MRLVFPPIINASGLLPFLVQLGTVPDFETEIVLDVSSVRRVSPAALAALVAVVNRWSGKHKRVRFERVESCPILGYLQRMDVLRRCGVDLPEVFQRHPAGGRFVPVQQINDVDALSCEVAGCIAPGGDEYGHPMSPLYDLAAYVLGELGANVRQHSRGVGFVVAQTSASEGLVRLAVADNGMGIRQSFIESGVLWGRALSDSAALQKAIEPRISSKGEPVNQGVGLTLVSGLARLTAAWMLLVSGTGTLRLDPDGALTAGELPDRANYHGTLAALTFRRDKLQEFYHLLHVAKLDAGLLVKRPINTKFS